MAACNRLNFKVKNNSARIRPVYFPAKINDWETSAVLEYVKDRTQRALSRANFATSFEGSRNQDRYEPSVKAVEDFLCDVYRDLCDPDSENYRLHFKFDDNFEQTIRTAVRGFMLDGVPISLESDIKVALDEIDSIVKQETLNALTSSRAINFIYDINSSINESRQKELRRSLFECLIANRSYADPTKGREQKLKENFGIVTSTLQMNKAIAAYQQSQYQILYNFLIDAGFSPEYFPQNMYSGKFYWLDNRIQNALLCMHNWIVAEKAKGTFDDTLQQQWINLRSIKNSDHTLLDAVNAYVNLKWFDDWIAQAFPKFVTNNTGMSQLVYHGNNVVSYKFNVNYSETSGAPDLYGKPFEDAIEKLNSFATITIESIPMYDHETHNRTIGSLSKQSFVEAFCILQDAAMQLDYTGKEGYETTFINAVVSLIDDPATSAKTMLKTLFRQDNKDLLNALRSKGMDDNEFDVLYSVYKAMYVDDVVGRKIYPTSFESMEANFLKSQGIRLSRFNLVDIMLSAMVCAVKNNYVESIFQSGKYQTKTRERYRYRTNLHGLEDSINSHVIDNPFKEETLDRYKINEQDPDWEGYDYTINIGGRFKLLVNLKGRTLLRKNDNYHMEIKASSIQVDETTGEERTVAINLPEIALTQEVRNRLVQRSPDRDNLNESLFYDIMSFVDDMLGLGFLSEDGLREYDLFRKLPNGKSAINDVALAAVCALKITEIYNKKDHSVKKDKSRYAKTELLEFMKSQDFIDTYLLNVENLSEEERKNYFTRDLTGAQLSTVSNIQLWLNALAQARSILMGESSTAVTYSVDNVMMPTYSQINTISKIKQDLIRKSKIDDPEMQIIANNNFFLDQAKYRHINRVCTSLKVQGVHGIIRNATRLTVSDLLYDQIINKWITPIIEKGVAYIQPTTNADKSNITLIEVAINSLFGWNKNNAATKIVSNETKEQLVKYFHESIGAIYRESLDKIINDYSYILPEINQIVDTKGKVTYLQKWLKTHNESDLLSLVDQYNATDHDNGPKHLVFKRELHYRNYSDANGRYMVLNELLYDNALSRYFDLDATRAALNEAKRAYAQSLIDNGVFFEIDIAGESKGELVLAQEDANALTTFFRKAQIKPRDWIYGNKMIIAKVNHERLKPGQKISATDTFELNPILESFMLLDTLLGNNLAIEASGTDLNMEIKQPSLVQFDEYKEFIKENLPEGYLTAHDNNGAEIDRLSLTDIGMALSNVADKESEQYKNVRRLYKETLNSSVETAAQVQQVKRNMALTATFTPLQQNSRKTFDKTLTVAVVDDYTMQVNDLRGNKTDFKPADGQIWTTGVGQELFQNALLGDRTANLSKPVIIFKDDEYASGGLIKCAMMGVSNEIMRMSNGASREMYRMHKKMLHHRWYGKYDLTGPCAFIQSRRSKRGKPINYLQDIAQGIKLYYLSNDALQSYRQILFFDKHILSDGTPVYYTKERMCHSNGDSIGNDPIRRVYHFFDEDGNHRTLMFKDMAKPKGETGDPNSEYNKEVRKQQASYNKMLQDIENSIKKEIDLTQYHTVDSLYELHKVFGGIYARELTNDGVLKYTEKNFKILANYVIHVTDRDGNQPLKKEMIDILAMQSAFKRGAGNINESTTFEDDTPLRTMEIPTKNFGKVNETENDIDDPKVTEMSQMINQLSGVTFALDDVMEVYDTLAQIALTMSDADIQAMKDYIKTNDHSNMYERVVAMLDRKFKARRGDSISQAHIQSISRDINKNTNHRNDASKIAFSDPNIYQQLLSIIGGVMTMQSLRRRYGGIGNIMFGSQGICQIYEYNGHRYLFDNVLRKALADITITVDENITDINLYNKERVRLYLEKEQAKQIKYTTTDRFIKFDNVRCVFTDNELNEIKATVSLAQIDDYYAFKNNPVAMILEKVYNLRINASGDFETTTAITADELRKRLDIAAKIQEAYSNGRYYFQKDVTKPRDLRDKNITWEYVEGGTQKFMSMYDDWRFLSDNKNEDGSYKVDPQTLFDELHEGVYRSSEDAAPVPISNMREYHVESIMPNIYRGTFIVGDRSMSEVLEEGPKVFREFLKPLDYGNYDIALISRKGNHEYISFSYPNKEQKLGRYRVKRIAVNDPSTDVANRVYAIDDNGNLLYEVGRDTIVDDVIYNKNDNTYRNKKTNKILKDQYKYIRISDNRIAKFVEFLTQSQHKINGRNILVHHIQLGNLKSSTLIGNETIADVLAPAIASLYGAGLYSGMQFKSTLSRKAYNAINQILDRLGEELIWDKHLSDYINKDVKNAFNNAEEIQEINPKTNKVIQLVKVNDTSLTDGLKKYRDIIADEIYTSYLMAQRYNQARIPGQGAQSSMEIDNTANFEEGGEALAVSPTNMYLQDSDCDGDHSWFMGHSFDGNGRYIGWSSLFDYSNIDMLHASMYLPMPKGKRYSFTTDIPEESDVFDISDDAHNLLSGHQSIKEAIRTVDGMKKFAEIARKLKNSPEQQTIIYGDLDWMSELIDLLNQHEATVIPIALKEGAQKNLISAYVRRIISDVRNSIRQYSQTGTPNLTRLSNRIGYKGNMLNPAFKLYMQYQNLEAKGNVGIAANGLASIYAWVYSLNRMIMYNPSRLKDYGMFKFDLDHIVPLKEDGSTWVVNMPPMTLTGSSELAERFVKYPAVMAADEIASEYISGTVDNAKNPILPNINATKNMMAMHLVLGALGVQPDQIVGFMNSPTVKFISEITSGSIFHRFHIKMYEAIQLARGNYADVIKERYGESFLNRLSSADYQKLIKGNVSGIQMLDAKPGTSDYNKLHNMLDLVEYIHGLRGVSVDDAEFNERATVFKRVYQAAQEFSALGILLGMKRKMPSSEDELYKLYDTIKRQFNQRVVEYNMDLEEQYKDQPEELKKHRINARPIDVEKFLSDEGYRKEIIDIYEQIKVILNPFDILNETPLYDAIFNLISVEHGMFKRLSMRQRIYVSMIGRLEQLFKGQIKPAAREHIERAIDNLFIQRYLMVNKNLTFPYHDGSVLIDADWRNDVRSGSGSFSLNTLHGIASFKRIFEDEVLPALTRGEYYTTNEETGKVELVQDASIANNPFISTMRKDRYNGIPYLHPRVNMYTADVREYNSETIKRLQDGLARLTQKINGLELYNWFAIYNLIVNKNRKGQRSMTDLFMPFINKKGSITKEYEDFLGSLDYEKGILEYSLDDTLLDAAPIVSNESGQDDYYIKERTDEGMKLKVKTSNDDYSGKYAVTDFPFLRNIDGETTAQKQDRQNLVVMYGLIGGQNMLKAKIFIDTLKTIGVGDDGFKKGVDTLANMVLNGYLNIKKLC